MLKSYLVVAARNLLKQKAYSIIKIAGLAFGLATSIVIYLYIIEDLSYDTMHANYHRMVRLLTIDNGEGVSSKRVGVTQPMLGPTAKAELPEVVESVRFLSRGRYDLSHNDQSLKCEAAFRVDPSVFDVFNFKVIKGPAKGILDNPGSIAITETLAKKIFGDEDPIGKTIKLNQTVDLNVTAVLADVPKNSHLQFDLLHSIVPGQNEDGFRDGLQTWQSIFSYTYLLLDKPANVPELNVKLQAITKANNATDFFWPVAQPLTDVHLRSKDILFESNANKSDILNVYVLSTIAGLILLLAIVNFMNLVTAKSLSRAKEVGMRKVIGAVRRQLVTQHLTESILVTFVSAVLAVGLVYLALPSLNSAYQRYADISMLFTGQSILLILIFVALVGLLSGIYPAFVLSSFKPIVVLKGAFKNSSRGSQMRKALVVLQFTISIALMVGTGIVFQQMQYIFNTDLGYSRDQVIAIQQNGEAIGRAYTLKTELLRNKNILSAGTSSTRLGQQLGRTNIFPEGATSETNIITSIMAADEHFLPTLGMKTIMGRNFSPDFGDSLSMIINEEMVRLLKWEDPVGRTISLQSGPDPDVDRTAYTVIGVVRDFHFATIRHKLEPMFMLYGKNNGALSIKISTADIENTIAYIEETWKKVNPGTTFEYTFLDEDFHTLYRNEEAFASMFTHFTVLALIIAGLGLFALSAFTAEQRKKEIGIRKVLGASNGNIFYKLSFEFIVLILISFAFASIIAYFTMEQWLQDFQYSVRIEAGVFLLAGSSAVFIALLTISFQAIKAAFSNPAEALRTE